jgi:hypothetical protein
MVEAVRTLAAITLLAAAITATAAEPLTVYRNDNGQITGYGERHGNTTVFTDPKGQQTGRAVRGRDGVTILYDASGRRVGTAKRH